MKYRSEVFYGEGYRNAAEVMAHEVFQMNNTDILHTLSNTILKGTPIGKALDILEEEINNDCESYDDADGNLYNLICDAYENEALGVAFFTKK